MNNLKLFPEFHDKIEFEVAITTFSFKIKKEIKKLPSEIFSLTEKKAIEKAYYEHFLKLMIPKSQGSLHYSNKEILKLNIQLKKIYKNNEISIPDLIDLCRLYGLYLLQN